MKSDIKPDLYFVPDKPKIILPFIILEFLNILLWISLLVLTVLVLGVYLTTTVDITTTVSVAVIASVWVVMMLYVWLCVVSHYQILVEVQSMGSDKVKVLQEVRYGFILLGNYLSLRKGKEDTKYISNYQLTENLHVIC